MAQRVVIPGFRKIETSGGGEVTGDYNDFFDFTEEDATELLEPTQKLISKLEQLIDDSE